MKESILALALLSCAAPGRARAESAAVSPYLFTGRLTDATHAAFDADKAATLSAYNASGRLLASSKTTHKAESTANYTLRIPMASEPASNCAVKGDTLALEVTDNNGKTWAGIVPPSESIVGASGEVKTLNIVLSSSSNEWGIDDALYEYLYDTWFQSDYYDERLEPFDPTYDHDGDGVSTINESFAGTDPFDASSRLAITAYTHNETGGSGVSPLADNESGGTPLPPADAITFTAQPSRAYILEGTNSLETPNWQPLAFSTDASNLTTTQSALSLPSSSSETTPTLYLTPVSSPAKFFRIRCE